MATVFSFFNRMPRRGKVVSVVGLLFVLLSIFITVYAVRQRQIYKSRAGSEMFTCDLQRSKCSSLGFIFATLSDCDAALIKAGHIGWKCYDSNDACLAECGGTGATLTPIPTTSTGAKMYICRTDTHSCIETTSLYTDVNTCAANVQQYVTYPNTGKCYTTQSSCQTICSSTTPTPTPATSSGATCTGVSVSKVISVGTGSYLEPGCSSLKPGDTVRVSVTGSGDSPEVSIGGAPWKKTTGCKYNATTNSQTCSLDHTVQSHYGNAGDSGSFTVRGRFRNPADGSWKECSGPTCHVVVPTAAVKAAAACYVKLFNLDWTAISPAWSGDLTKPTVINGYPGQEIYLAALGTVWKCNSRCTSNADCAGLPCLNIAGSGYTELVCRNPACSVWRSSAGPSQGPSSGDQDSEGVFHSCICPGDKPLDQHFSQARFIITQGSNKIVTDWVNQTHVVTSTGGTGVFFYYKYTLPSDSTPVIFQAEVQTVAVGASSTINLTGRPLCEFGMVYPKTGGPGIQFVLSGTPPATTPTPTGSQTPTPAGGLGGDLNGDGCVNIIDLGILIDNYNPSAPSCIPK